MAITLTCGHSVERLEDMHDVSWEEEQCIAGDGFVPCTVYAVYCPACAEKMKEEVGHDEG
jgi:hypothetical protein